MIILLKGGCVAISGKKFFLNGYGANEPEYKESEIIEPDPDLNQ